MSVKFSKIQRPQLPQAYLRQRLFGLLDAAAIRPMTWISANAGAGKTVLVTSYLEARCIPELWYRLDKHDVDTATFFYYLREAACTAELPGAEHLPLLTKEYVGAEMLFAQMFFAQLFAEVPQSFALVFDNYQDLPEASALHAILGESLQEIPSNVRIFILSREAPPAWLVRWQVDQGVTFIDPPAMRIDREETAAILSQQSATAVSQETIDTIYHEADGWAAGVILLYEHFSRYGRKESLTHKDSREAMFRYFATELFENASSEMRSFLTWTALMPQFDIEMARTLTGMHNVDKLLHELLRRNYFIYEHEAHYLSYQYHPLFRQFLRDIYLRNTNHAHYQKILHAAAKVLRDSGQVEDAVDLYIEAGDWRAVAEIVIQEAQLLYTQGRSRQLGAWITAIPDSLRYEMPWLDYWFAVCHIGYDLYVSREAFKCASEGFTEAGDILGRSLAAAGVVDTYIYEQGNFCPLDRWIAELDVLLIEHGNLLPEDVLARISIALFNADIYRRPDHPNLPELSQQVYRIIERIPDEFIRLTAGIYLLFYFTWWQGDMTKADAVVKLLKPLEKSSHVSPFLKIVWISIQSTYAWMSGKTADAIEFAEQGLQISAQSGMHVWDFMLLAQAGWGALTSDNLTQACDYLERMAENVQPGRLIDLCQYHYLLFVEALHRKDNAAMQEHSSAALQLAHDAGVPWAEGVVLPACARVAAINGDINKARNMLAKTNELAKSLGSSTIYYGELLTRVELGLSGDDSLAALREFMQVSRRSGFVNSSLWRSEAMSRVFTQALKQGIEISFAQEVIKLRGLLPPEAENQLINWPWPIRIFTLGRFSLVQQDETVMFGGKAQKKPLQLLKALIAFGGSEVNETTLMEAVWPDSDSEMAKQNLKSAVYRLRKLLAVDIVMWRNGRLSLDARHCWVDVLFLKKMLNNLLHKPPADSVQLEQAMQLLDELYQGGFLEGEEAPFALSVREQVREKVLCFLQKIGESFAAQGDYERALATYRKGLEVEPLEERFYRDIMQCQRAQKRIADALSTYEHYRKLILNALGLKPSTEMAELVATLQTEIA